MKALRLAPLLLLAAAGCPRSPATGIPSIDSRDEVDALRATFNADVEHRRVLVLLSPT